MSKQTNKNVSKSSTPPSIPDIFKMAEKIAKDMPSPDGDEKLNMDGMIKHVTESVMNMMSNGDVDINTMMQGLMQGGGDNPLMSMMGAMQQGAAQPQQSVKPIANSKVKLPGQESNKEYKFKEPVEKNNFEELDDDDEADTFNPRTKDIEIKINVNLEDFYNGTTKKLAVRRKRLKKDSNGKIVQVEEKKKILIPIEPGMRDEQVIRFNKEADEAQGYESGDIVITLYENAHSRFEREANNLFIMKNISLYEAFAASCGENIDLTVKNLDGSILKLITDSKPLHINEGIRKVTGEGMPLYKQDEKGDLYVRFNLVLPEKFKKEDMEILKKLFPCCNETEVITNKTVRDVKLEEVSESDLEELDYGYSESESEYSDSSSSSSEESEPPRKGFRQLPKGLRKQQNSKNSKK